MNNIEKILNLIKTNKTIAEDLFMYAGFPEDIKLFTGYEEDNHDFSNIQWLFQTDHQNLTLVGVNTKDNTIWTIDDEGDFHQDCDSLQDLPYEIIRIECLYTENETVQEYFDKFDNYDFKAILKRYEDWCKENNIELDKNKVYHDENGDLSLKTLKEISIFYQLCNCSSKMLHLVIEALHLKECEASIMLKNKFTVIQNTKSFFYNSYLVNYPFIESKMVSDFSVAIEKQIKPEIGYKLLKLLNIYFYLYDIKLSYVEFANSSNKKILDNFLIFIASDFVTTEIKAQQQYRNYLIRIAECLNDDRFVKIDFDKNLTLKSNYDFSKLKDKLDVINGVSFNRTDNINLCFINYESVFGIQETLRIYKYISLYPNHNKINVGMFNVFNTYISYLVSEQINFFNTDTELLSKFVVFYFSKLESNKIKINAYKPFWNDFIIYLGEVFNFNMDSNFLMLKTKRSAGNQTNIAVKNNKEVKSKLITDVPLEVCDNKSIHILKSKVEQDLEIIEKWAKQVISDYIEQQNIGEYPSEDFFIEGTEKLKTKYKMWREGSPKNWIANHFNLNSIMNKKHLFAIYLLLVINHPSITEQFLIELTQDSIVETDNGMFLVGKKHRKGKNYSEQKILLNNYSKSLILLLLENSKKMGLLIKSKSLSLHINPPVWFKIISLENAGIKKTKEIDESICSFIIENYGFEESIVSYFIKKITLTKLRATCAIKDFFQHQSTKKMSEVLGHEHYNSSLLTHYLPEPIIHFYQSRWIRIFQKGIIYESMKNSEFLLSAIGFKDMETLDEFLKNHILKNLPTHHTEKITNAVIKEQYDECYISINEENLTALLSLKEAVNQSEKKDSIKESAFFWADFAEKVTSEIQNNKSYYSFTDILLKAKDNCRAENYKEVIYA